jgi:hypothetical protein
MITGGFLGALVFSLCFFGIYSLHQAPFAPQPNRMMHAIIAVLFLVLAWALSWGGNWAPPAGPR